MSPQAPRVLPCLPCSTPPQGILGHAHLRVQFLGSGQMMFQCAQCNRFWLRTGGRDGPFEWTATSFKNSRTASRGIPVPPRTNPAINYG